jgi:HlyD family secretion protein
MNGDVDIIISEKSDVLLVPITAVIEDGDETFVWLVEGGKARKRTVEVGVSSVNETEIIKGLDSGEVVVTRPPIKIEEGSKLKILK